MSGRASFIFAAVALAICGCAEPQSPARPNVLLVLVDDLGFSDVGAFGGEIATPTLDRLAAGGIRFTQFHNTSKCFPSRAALLTGLYPEQVDMDESASSRIGAGVTFAEALGAAGYATFMVGKHHGLDNPYDRGFDRYAGLRDGASNHFNPGLSARPGEPPPARKEAMKPDGRWWCFDADCLQGWQPDSADFYTTDFYTDTALGFLAEAREGGKPFLLYLAYQAPHDPLQAWPADIARYEDRYRAGYAAIADARYRRLLESGLLGERYPRSEPVYRDWEQLDPAEQADQARRMAVYAAMIDRLDQGLGRIVAYLEKTGELDDTLILFTSDNGASAERVYLPGTETEIGAEHPIGTVGRWASLGADWANVSNVPFRLYKNFAHEGGTAAPAILHWPGGVRDPGRVLHANAHLIDVFPTLLELAGARYPQADPAGDTPPPLEGMSLVPYLESSRPVERAAPVFQRWQRGRSVRTERWKLTSLAEPGQAAEQGRWRLYDMTVDRTETNDVAAAHADVVERLSRAYDGWLARVKPEALP